LNSVRNYPTVMISVAGGVANQQTYLLDGANHNDAYNGLNLPLPFPDALQEFRVRRMKEMGANALRTSHNPPTPELLAKGHEEDVLRGDMARDLADQVMRLLSRL